MQRVLRHVVVAATCLAVTIPVCGQAVDATTSLKLSLHDAIQQAEASPQARTGQDQVDAARGQVLQAGLRPNPRLYLEAEDLRPWAGNYDFTTQTEDFGYFGQMLELGGKRGRRIDFATARVHQVEAERILLLQQIAGRVAVAYWNAVVSAGLAQLLEDDMTAVDEIVLYNKARVDAGAMRGIDLIRVQLERDRLRLALESARREVVLTRIELLRQMGRPVGGRADRQIELTDALNTGAPLETKTLATVLAARADVAAARDAVATAEADVKLQRAVGVPDVDALLGYKRNLVANTAYASVQIPLAFRNRNQGEVARTEAVVRFAKDRQQQLELSVAADISAAEQAYTQQQTVIRDILPEMRVRAKQNLTIMDEAYRTGGVDLLRYLDAERTAFDVEASALRTLSEFQQAGLRLQLAYGVYP